MTAFSATYADFKVVKTRGQAQFVFEVPLELADAALAALGGLPRPDREQWVGVAPLDPSAAQKPAEKPKGGKLAQRAGILCGEPAFREFIREKYGMPSITKDGLAHNVRTICRVNSRADLDHDEEAGNRLKLLEADYRQWMRT